MRPAAWPPQPTRHIGSQHDFPSAPLHLSAERNHRAEFLSDPAATFPDKLDEEATGMKTTGMKKPA
jgi:hypothetical protein